MKLHKVLSLTLSAALITSAAALSGAALAADTEKQPTEHLLIAPGPAQAPDYTVEKLYPFMVYGRADSVSESRIELSNDNEADPYQKISVMVGEDTLILDAVTGEAKTMEDLKEGESLYAYVGPAVGYSLPPAAGATLVLCNIPADFRVPTFAEVESVSTGEDGKMDVTMSGDIILHLNGETELMAHNTKNVVGLDDIVPGARLLSWYSAVALSFPAQATPSKVMVFPSQYDGTIAMKTTGADLKVNGAPVELLQSEIPTVAGEGLRLPLRKVAEALGCQVTWSPENNAVAVMRDGVELYHFTIGESTVVAEGDMVINLAAPLEAQEGVTFMDAGDLISIHNLKVTK